MEIAQQNAMPVFCGRLMGRAVSIFMEFADEQTHIDIALDGRSKIYAQALFNSTRYPEEKLPFTHEELLTAGSDLLAGMVLKNGEPGWESVSGLLPQLSLHAHGYLSGPAAAGGYLLKRNGVVTRQGHCNDEDQQVIFTPVMLDAVLGKADARIAKLDGWMPIYVIRHQNGDECLETMLFVSPGDPSDKPVIWISANWHRQNLLVKTLYACMSEEEIRTVEIAPVTFWDACITAVLHWHEEQEKQCRFVIPEKKLEQTVYASLAGSLCTFTGVHAHYGHQQYSLGIHDNFPPNYISMAETLWALGRLPDARRVVEHALLYSIDACGRFIYRQGSQQQYGSSGSDYGMWLWLIDRIEPSLGPKGWLDACLPALASMGDMLIGNIAPYPDKTGRRLLLMCPEADANNRVYAYLNNNLWAANGLAALGRLFNRYGRDGSGYTAMARELLCNTLSAAREEAATCWFGTIPPFRLGYPALPLTLSCCRDTALPTDQWEYDRYMKSSSIWEAAANAQEYSENTYANYRYYLEMLSSMQLPHDWADSIVNMRERLGGELLGMTRFLDRLDDWPASNYARFLLSTDRLDKYLLLLYAHCQYHGSEIFSNYYEQAGIDGKVYAPGCVPCQLLAPLMTAWMFCFEPVGEDAVYLLRGIPEQWFLSDGFSAEGLGGSVAPLDVAVGIRKDALRIDVAAGWKDIQKKVYLDIHTAGEIAADEIQADGAMLMPTGRRNRFLLEPCHGAMKCTVVIQQKRSRVK